METQPNQPDDAIDKVLAALNNVAPPDGLEARVAARVTQRSQQSPAHVTFPWRNLLGSTLVGAWWRGAATGLAVAILAVAAVLLFRRASFQSPPAAQLAVTRSFPTPAAIPVKTSESPAACASPKRLRSLPAADAHRADRTTPPHATPDEPLTPQERELVRLAQRSDPKALVTLNTETQTRLEAQNAADFAKFFAPPPSSTTLAPEDHPSANPEINPTVNP
jgi:hypothetical protein